MFPMDAWERMLGGSGTFSMHRRQSRLAYVPKKSLGTISGAYLVKLEH